MTQEPLISKSPAGVSVLLAMIVPVLGTLGWMLDKVVTLDERVSEVHARQDRLKEVGLKTLERGIKLDEQVVRNTTTIELLHERLDRLESLKTSSLLDFAWSSDEHRNDE